MKSIIGVLLLVASSFGYLVVSSPEVRDRIGGAAGAIARPILIPVVELINVPAFVYTASLVIIAAGAAACLIYRVSIVAPRLAELRRVRVEIGNMPVPRARPSHEAWIEGRQRLGVLLSEDTTFTTAWSAFVAEAVRSGSVPQRSFSSYATREPDPPSAGDELMASLPGYFTSVGLILTFIGLVVALYFAAKGFSSGDFGEARAAIVRLLNAASFKFLTSVSALVSALATSLFTRYTAYRTAYDRSRTMTRVDVYIAEWRDRLGAGSGENTWPSDLLTRFDTLLGQLDALSADVRRLVAHAEAKGGDAAV